MTVETLAPIAIFAFKRSSHLSATLDALERCPEFAASDVTVYVDGPRGAADEPGVNAVRDLLASRRLPNMKVIAQSKNVGLANSIIGAVSETVKRHGRVIVVEDDLIFQPTTLTWLNRGLETYKTHQEVMQISAYQYRSAFLARQTMGSFQHFATTWGWATWDRAWEKFDASASGWEAVREDPAVRRAFDADGVYPFSDMLEKQMSGKLDSWGIRWSWSVFRNNGLTLMPPRSLVRNIGFDGTATHNSLGPLKRFAAAPAPLLWDEAAPPALPGDVAVQADEEVAFRRALKGTHALRNHRIKQFLAQVGFTRFSN